MDKKSDQKLDKIVEDITIIKVTLGEQHVSLKDHIRRTNLLEAKLIPVEKHVNMVNGALKFIGILAMIAGIVEATLRMMK